MVKATRSVKAMEDGQSAPLNVITRAGGGGNAQAGMPSAISIRLLSGS